MTLARHRVRPLPKGIVLVVVLAGMLLGPGAVGATRADAQSGELEPATIRSRSGDPIAGGGSATEFTIDLPDGAQCPGDSANDDYRVGSYMLPATVDPFAVEWSGEGPVPYGLNDYEAFRQPLYDDLTSGFSSKMLAENPGPGQPGQILDFPAFTFDVFEPGMVPPGRYRIGIVCNHFAEVTTAWSAEIEVVADSQDAPGRFTWALVEGQASGASDQGSFVLWVVAVGGLAAGAAALLLLRVRRHHATSTSPETTKGIR